MTPVEFRRKAMADCVRAGQPPRDVARAYGVSPPAVYTAMAVHGVRTSDARLERIIELLRQGMTRPDVAKHLGIAMATVQSAVTRYESKTGDRLPRHHHKRRDVSAIVAEYRAGATLKEIGERLNITRERVRQLIKQHERETGSTVERHKPGIPLGTERVPRTVWRCPGCGAERRVIPSDHHPTMCLSCHAESHQNIELISQTVAAILSGSNFNLESVKAGYSKNAGWQLVRAVYSYLRRHNEQDTIARLWPRGVPRYLQKWHPMEPVT